MTAASATVSVVIPTLNAGRGFRDLLEGVARQEGSFEREVLVVDSGSTNDTVEVACHGGARVHQIARAEFDHGATRSLGVSLARGDFVALTVQDAIPIDEHWLASMVEELERDPRVAGVYGRHVPHPGTGLLARSVVNNLATAGLERREQSVDGLDDYAGLPAARRRRLATFDDVSSCIRRSAWEEIPFEPTSFGEDLRWGKRVVEAGYKLVYQPRSAVFHSHDRGPLYDLRRHYVDQAILAELFGFEPVPSLRGLLVRMGRSAIHRHRLLRAEAGTSAGRARLWALAARYAAPSELGAYLAGRRRRLATRAPRVARELDGLLSRGV